LRVVRLPIIRIRLALIDLARRKMRRRVDDALVNRDPVAAALRDFALDLTAALYKPTASSDDLTSVSRVI